MSNLEKAKKLATEARIAYANNDNPKYGMSILRLDKILKQLSKEEKQNFEAWLAG